MHVVRSSMRRIFTIRLGTMELRMRARVPIKACFHIGSTLRDMYVDGDIYQ